MSKAIEQFNNWHEDLVVPAEILTALEEEAEAIDKVMVDRYYWCYRKGIDSCVYYAQALASIICEHELATKEQQQQ